MLGEATDRGPVLRSGAKVGDWLMVTGPLGGSIRGHHLDFTPRVREALALHQAADLHAMIDLSDGLAKDLHHICEESRCGAVLCRGRDSDRNAASCDVARSAACRTARTFELVFTVSPGDGGRLLRDQPVPGITLVPHR